METELKSEPPAADEKMEDEKMDTAESAEDGREAIGEIIQPDQLSSECLDDPNFAIICSFLENFSQHIRLGEFPFDELQLMLENTTEVPDRLIKLHIALLRRVFKTITVDKWERSLSKFGHTYCNQDGWEIERFGYKKAKLQTKLRILKNLLEAQFDYNVKFKAEVNKLEAKDLRLMPLGRDCEGQVYWYQVDNDANLRVYREDADDETWEIVASNREEFCELIEKLQKGDVKRPETEAALLLDEDSNEKEIETKEIILDTGKVENELESDEDESEEEESDEEKLPKNLISKEIDTSSKSICSSVKTHDNLDEQNKTSAIDKNICQLPDKMEIDESSALITSSPPVKIKVPDKKETIQPINLGPVSLNIDLKPIKSEMENIVEIPMKETLILKVESKVHKSEMHPKPPYHEVSNSSEPVNLSLIKEPSVVPPVFKEENRKIGCESISKKVKNDIEPRSVLEKLESEVIKDGIMRADEKVSNELKNFSKETLIDDKNKNNKSEESNKNTKEITEETIKKTKTWVCGDSSENNLDIISDLSLKKEKTREKLDLTTTTKTKPMQNEITPITEQPFKIDEKLKDKTTFESKDPNSETLQLNPIESSKLAQTDTTKSDQTSAISIKPDQLPQMKNTLVSVPERESAENEQITTTDVIDMTIKPQVLKHSPSLVSEKVLNNESVPLPEKCLTKEKMKIEHSSLKSKPCLEPKQIEKKQIKSPTTNSGIPVSDDSQKGNFADGLKSCNSIITEPSKPIDNALILSSDFAEGLKTSKEIKKAFNLSDISKTGDMVEGISKDPKLSSKSEIPVTAHVKSISPLSKSVTVKSVENCPSKPVIDSLPEKVTNVENIDSVLNENLKKIPDKIKSSENQRSILVDTPLISTQSNSQSQKEESQEIKISKDFKVESKKLDFDSEPDVNAKLDLVQESSEPDSKSFEKSIASESNVAQDPPSSQEKLKSKESEAIIDKIPVNQKSALVSKVNIPNILQVSNNSIEVPLKSHPKDINVAEISKSTTESVLNTDIISHQKKDTKQVAGSIPGLGLVCYDSSSDEDGFDVPIPSSGAFTKACEPTPNDIQPDVLLLKRKAEEQLEAPSKIAKVEEKKSKSIAQSISNPIIGEAIEEEMMHIIGEGSGAQNEGGNEDDVLTAKHSTHDKTLSSQEDSSNDDSQESLEVQMPKKRGRKPGKRGRKPGPKPASTNTTLKERKSRGSSGTPKSQREIARLGVPVDTLEVNGSNEAANDRPVRASRRIAQIRLKEEEERRKLEEERLAQLKAAQVRKQKRKEEMEKLVLASGGTIKPKKSKKSSNSTNTASGAAPDYLPSPSATDSDSGEEDDIDEFQVKKVKGKKNKRKSNGKLSLKSGNKPWATSSSDEDSEAVEEEEEYHYEEEEHLVFNESDHEFSPESDLGEDDEARPSRHARTAKKEKIEEIETGCKKCSKGDHPEWILLCDKCDQGWHASCLRPQLWVIPEGEWFCPPCQHTMLVTKLSTNLIEYDKLLKKRENDILRKERLAFVNVSLNNVLPDKTEEEKETEAKETRKLKEREKKFQSRRRRILSDEELSDTFINDRSDQNSSEESEDEPIYRLRARRAAKSFDYKEYDEMINTALRVSDDEDEEVMDEEQVEQQVDKVQPNNGKLNGDGNGGVEIEEQDSVDETTAPVEEEKHSGKNEAYEKYLEQAEDEQDSDDELMDEKERLRRKAAKGKGGNKKKKRSFRDLEDYTDEDNSDEDFKGSDVEDEDELDEDAVEEDESEWSGDNDDSDDSIARRSRVTAKGKKVKYGRREEYLEVGAVRRSTRTRRKARVSYDESDQDDDDEPEEKWQSGQSEEEETPSESDDETYGKKKKQKKTPTRSAVPRFFLGAISKEKKQGGSSSKKKKRKVDEDDVDRAWNSSQGSKAKKKAAEEQVERKTRGMKINFKDILDSGESDDDGNMKPKRRRISSDEEEDEAETSRRLAEEIKAANQREAAMYAAQQQKTNKSSSNAASSGNDSTSSDKDHPSTKKDKSPPSPSEAATVPISLEPNSNSKTLLGELIGEPRIDKNEKSNADKSPSTLELEMALTKPVPAPPIPLALAKALGRTKSTSNHPAGSGAIGPQSKPHPNLSSELSQIPKHLDIISSSAPLAITSNVSILSPSIPPISLSSSTLKHHPLSGAPITTSNSSSSKKERSSKSSRNASNSSPILSSTPPANINPGLRPMTPPMQQPHGLIPTIQGLPPGLPIDMGRVNPTLYQGNPAMRPFHPMWVRNSAQPSYTGGPPPTSIGKPPPLNSGPFLAQHGPRPGFPSQPPPLRIPNPNTSPLQAFQHFKREAPLGPGMYRMPLGLVGHQGPPDRFFGAPPHYPPYGILPPHTQSQPHQPLFGVPPYDFRPGESLKEEIRSTPPSTSSPPISQPLPSNTSSGVKDQPESEFGGLVSYFSSQRSEEDMDS